MAVGLVAPSAYLFLRDTSFRHTRRNGFTEDHLSVFVSGFYSWESPGLGWLYSGDVEIKHGPLYGELRIENVDYRDLGYARFETLRLGYFVHPWPAAAGGITLGYRLAYGDSVQNAVEVGFPLYTGNEKAWMRMEPIYLISSAGITWNYRFQFEAPLSHTPLLFGFVVEAKPLRQGAVYLGIPRWCSGCGSDFRSCPDG